MPLRRVSDLPRTKVRHNPNHEPPKDLGVGIRVYECPACLWGTTISRYPEEVTSRLSDDDSPSHRAYPEPPPTDTGLDYETLLSIYQEDLVDWHLERRGFIQVSQDHLDARVLTIDDINLNHNVVFVTPLRDQLAQSVW